MQLLCHRSHMRTAVHLLGDVQQWQTRSHVNWALRLTFKSSIYLFMILLGCSSLRAEAFTVVPFDALLVQGVSYGLLNNCQICSLHEDGASKTSLRLFKSSTHLTDVLGWWDSSAGKRFPQYLRHNHQNLKKQTLGKYLSMHEESTEHMSFVFLNGVN